VKLLLDTCTFLWIAEAAERLPPRVIDAYRSPRNELYLSTASSMEIAVKYSTKRLMLAEPPPVWLPRLREAHGVEALAIDEESALHVSLLPLIHRDPFDRLLVAQAIVHGMIILTPDPIVTRYPARTMW
jgi:PIN domain nuclease of toxin-antitoxin system